jgi:hypothetical protein
LVPLEIFFFYSGVVTLRVPAITEDLLCRTERLQTSSTAFNQGQGFPMPKFYVTTGRVREMIIARDAEEAALEALDRFFEPHHWVFSCPALSPSDRRAHFGFEALISLDSEIRVNQRGFDSPCADRENDLLSGRLVFNEAFDTSFDTSFEDSFDDFEDDFEDIDREHRDTAIFDTADLVDLHFRLAQAMNRFVASFGGPAQETVDFAELVNMA